MTPKQIEKMNELAKSELIGFDSKIDAHAVAGFRSGYTAAHNDATAIIEKLEKALQILSEEIESFTFYDGPTLKSSSEIFDEALAELNKWRNQ